MSYYSTNTNTDNTTNTKPSNPYIILGVSKEDSLDKINKVYRNFMLLCHPDKYKTEESIKLGLTYTEKMEMFSQIQNAYKEIVGTKKESNAPDYDIRYDIDSDYYQSTSDLNNIRNKQNIHYELLSHISNDINNITKTKKTELLFFNKLFEQRFENNSNNIDSTNNDNNPFGMNIGYNSVFKIDEKRYIEYNKIKQNGYNRDLETIVEDIDMDVDIETDIDISEINRKHYSIMKREIIKEQYYNSNNCFELGVSSENFGNYTTCRNLNNDENNFNIHCTDLLEAYSTSQVIDKSLNNKTNNSKINDKHIEDLINERRKEQEKFSDSFLNENLNSSTINEQIEEIRKQNIDKQNSFLEDI